MEFNEVVATGVLLLLVLGLIQLGDNGSDEDQMAPGDEEKIAPEEVGIVEFEEFRDVTLDLRSYRNCTFINCTLTNTKISYSDVNNCTLIECIVVNTSLSSTIINESELEHCFFIDCLPSNSTISLSTFNTTFPISCTTFECKYEFWSIPLDPPPFTYPKKRVTTFVQCRSPFIFINENGTFDLYWYEYPPYSDGDYPANVTYGGILYMRLDSKGTPLTEVIQLPGTYLGPIEGVNAGIVAEDVRLVKMDLNDGNSTYFVVSGDHVVEMGSFENISLSAGNGVIASYDDVTVSVSLDGVVDVNENITVFEIPGRTGKEKLIFTKYSDNGTELDDGVLVWDIPYSAKITAVAGENGTIYLVFREWGGNITGGILNETGYIPTVILRKGEDDDLDDYTRNNAKLILREDRLHLLYIGESNNLQYRQFDATWDLIYGFNTSIEISTVRGGFDFTVNGSSLNILYSNASGCLNISIISIPDGEEISGNNLANRTWSFWRIAKKPNIYLYPSETITDSVSVTLPGNATITIPEIPLGHTITWEGIQITPDGSIMCEGEEYSYLFYEGEFNQLTSDMGWKLERIDDELFLNRGAIEYEELARFFEQELTEAGFYEKEIDDFTEYWLGPDELLFFGQKDFDIAVMYIPQGEVDDVCTIATGYSYDAISRYFLSVIPWEPGMILDEPTYPNIDKNAGSSLHEWGVIQGLPLGPAN